MYGCKYTLGDLRIQVILQILVFKMPRLSPSHLNIPKWISQNEDEMMLLWKGHKWGILCRYGFVHCIKFSVYLLNGDWKAYQEYQGVDLFEI